MAYSILFKQCGSDHMTRGRSRAIDRIVVHFTATLASARNNATYFARNEDLGHPEQLGLRADHLLERVEGAAPRGPPVGGGLALPPVLGDRVPVHAVPPRDLAEVRLSAGPPVDVQLSHCVSLHIPLLPGRIPDRSIVPLAQLVKVR